MKYLDNRRSENRGSSIKLNTVAIVSLLCCRFKLNLFSEGKATAYDVAKAYI